MDNLYLWYWFVNIPGIGVRTRHHLLDMFGHPKVIWDLPFSEVSIYLTKKQYHSFKYSKNPEKIYLSYKKLRELNIHFVPVEDKSYPKQLKNIDTFPHALYVRGRLPDVSLPLLAVVGARNPTAYGKEAASYFVKELAGAGIGIVSGLASGIDAVAHQSALQSNQYSLGVLGGGIDTIYPRENFSLYFDMYQRGGVISEYNLGTANLPGYFPERNRIISGMSSGVLIVEAGEKSGSLITADLALEQGKEIYAIPGRITDPLSRGCNNIISQGARLVRHPKEIIEDYMEQYHINTSPDETMNSNLTFENELEEQVYSILDVAIPKSPNEIKQYMKIDFSLLLRILLNMEMKQLIRQEGHQMYVKIL